MVFCNKKKNTLKKNKFVCHNPYFNRWFSAIPYDDLNEFLECIVTILILIDGFLQLGIYEPKHKIWKKSQSLF